MKRTVIQGDAIKWLEENKNNECIITSMPDMSECGIDSKDEYIIWLKHTTQTIINSLSSHGSAFFFQTDRKKDGKIIDKKSIITNVFYENDWDSVMSKIVLQLPPESVYNLRPTFTNLFGFSKTHNSGKATPDVIYKGDTIHKYGMSIPACNLILDWIDIKMNGETIVNPFSGSGTILFESQKRGYNSIGIELDEKLVEQSRNHTVPNISKFIEQ